MQIPVLDKGFVELLLVSPSSDPCTHIVNAARVSYAGESKGEEKDKKLFEYLWRNGHTSPFEMATMQIRIKAPLFVVTHWLRHRTSSYNFESHRYTAVDDHEFYCPSSWRVQDTVNKQSSNGYFDDETSAAITNDYEKLHDMVHNVYNTMLELGVAREMARMVLPTSTYTKGIVSANLLNWLRFVDTRTDASVQFETRQYALVVNSIIRDVFPWVAECQDKYGSLMPRRMNS